MLVDFLPTIHLKGSSAFASFTSDLFYIIYGIYRFALQ